MSRDLLKKVHSRRKGKNTAADIAAQLAPLEEQNRDAARKQDPRNLLEGANQEHGAIVVDNKNMQLPKGVDQAGEGKSSLGVEPVVIVIVIVMLVFIAFIAWQVSQMPTQ